MTLRVPQGIPTCGYQPAVARPEQVHTPSKGLHRASGICVKQDRLTFQGRPTSKQKQKTKKNNTNKTSPWKRNEMLLHVRNKNM